MQDHERLTPGEKELEAAWRSLTLTAPNLSRDNVMFLAGRAACRRQMRLWQSVSSGLLVLLLVSIVLRPGSQQPAMVPDNLAQGVQSAHTADDSQRVRQQLQPFRDYVHMRSRLLEHGLDCLPAARPALTGGSGPALNRDQLDDIFSSI